MTKWHKQAGIITTNMKVKIDFTLPEFRVTKIVMWEYHVDESDRVRYNMILVRNILKSLRLNLKSSKPVIESGERPLKGSTAPMIYLVYTNLKI